MAKPGNLVNALFYTPTTTTDSTFIMMDPLREMAVPLVTIVDKNNSASIGKECKRVLFLTSCRKESIVGIWFLLLPEQPVK